MRFPSLTAPAVLLAIGVSTIASAQTGTLVVVNKGDSSASIIDIESGNELSRVKTGADPHESVISPDGKIAVVGNYGGQTPGDSLTVIDIESGEVTKTIDLGRYRRPHGMAILPDNKTLLSTAEMDKALAWVDLETGEVTGAVETGELSGHMVAVTPDGKHAYVANIVPGTVSAIDVTTRELVTNIQIGKGHEGLDVSPDGREVWAGNRETHQLTIIDTEEHEQVAQIPCGQLPFRVKFTPDGSKVIATCAVTNDVAIFDAKERKEVGRVAMTEHNVKAMPGANSDKGIPLGIIVSGDSRYAFVTNINADSVAVIDLEKLELVKHINTGPAPDGIAWTGEV